MSSSDWWAKKLGTPPAPQQGRPEAMPVMPPSQQPMTQMPPFQQAQTPSLVLPSSSQVNTCPECRSANYMAVANAAPRCYDCGYPITQAGSRYGSLTGAHVEGAAQGARGNDSRNNYNPQEIIGRING